MAFWSAGNVDPKRKYNWLCEISADSEGGKIESWVVKSVTKPGWTTTEAVHRFLNYTFYYPGKVEWDEITLKLVDPGGNKDTAQTLYHKLASSGWKMPTSPTDISTISKANAMGRIAIRQIDHDNFILEEWILKNAWVKSVKFGELNYEDDGLMEIDLTLRYDWAELKHQSGGAVAAGNATRDRRDPEA